MDFSTGHLSLFAGFRDVAHPTDLGKLKKALVLAVLILLGPCPKFASTFLAGELSRSAPREKGGRGETRMGCASLGLA